MMLEDGQSAAGAVPAIQGQPAIENIRVPRTSVHRIDASKVGGIC
jgi:hypothetical protein